MRISLIIILLLLNFCTTISAQIVANFTAANVSGCSPLSVSFINQSTGTNLSYQWSFGNGNTSTLKDPFATYLTPGKYSVALIVSDGATSQTITKTNYITVFANPVSNFASPSVTSGCVPLTIFFNDNSTQGDTIINHWLWDFGDGATSNSQNPNHLYGAAGTYPVSLQITDAHGCPSAKSIANFVTTSPRPVAGFTISGAQYSCLAPFTVSFLNGSTGGTNLTYQWSFGDGDSSSSQNIIHTYTSTGQYTVTLIVTTPSGCSDTLTKTNFIIISNVVANFNIANDTVCLGASVHFSNASVGGTSFAWNFGDGGIATTQNPNHIYTAVGTYPVTLITSNGPSCKDTVTKSVEVIELIATGSFTPHYSCELPVQIIFSASALNATNYTWSVTPTDPPLIVSNSSGTDTASFNQAGIFTGHLVVENALGCIDSLNLGQLNISLINAGFSVDTSSGCIPLGVHFTDSSAPHDTIVSWHWDFGDGDSSDVANPYHVYSNDSSYTATLSITNSNGCVSEYTKTIVAGTHQVPNFSVIPTVLCASAHAYFTDLSTDSTLIDTWLWSFGDGTGGIEQNPQHSFIDTGYMTVTEIVSYNGCSDTLVVDSAVYIKGAFCNFSSIASCDSPLVWHFNGVYKGVKRFFWDFGDASPFDSLTKNPIHTFPNTGNYYVTLFSFNDSTGCNYDTTFTIKVRDAKAQLQLSDTLGCAPAILALSGMNSIDTETYEWYMGDGFHMPGSDLNQSVGHLYVNSGNYIATLIVRDMYGCPDTAHKTIDIYKPDAAFVSDTTTGCSPATIHFDDMSIQDTTITQWSWSFGDGGLSNVQNPDHYYIIPGYKIVILIVTDIMGCKDTIVKPSYINITQPNANFVSPNSRNICEGDSVIFMSTSTGNNISLFWEFGDGATSTLINPWHQYADSGHYNVILTVTDINGCKAIKTQLSYIAVQNIPSPEFVVDTMIYNCYPHLVKFNDISTGGNVNQWFWSFGDSQSGSIIHNPQHNYTYPGVYTVTLIAVTSFGCRDTMEKPYYIEIRGPQASFNLFPDTVCQGLPVTFYITSASNVGNFKWDFGDGVLGYGDTVQHSYNTVGPIYPNFIYNNIMNTCPKSATDTLFVPEIIAAFQASDTVHCVPLNVEFTNQSANENQWHWNFGDLALANTENSSHSYNSAGTYMVSLAVKGDYGCLDTARKLMIVNPIPSPVIAADTSICQSEKVQLTAFGGNQYIWSPSATLNNAAISNPIATPLATTTYTVTVTNTYNCKASKPITIHVQEPIQLTTRPDTILIVGENVDLTSSASQNGLAYHWTPADGLSCTDCASPIATPIKTTEYSVVVTDANNCFEVQGKVKLEVRYEFSIDVPTAFSPNGDSKNDIIYVKGWGLKKLLEFKIYNRWGEKVFESNDFNVGWDGYYKGQLQNIETYVYVASAETFEGRVLSKKGYISLIR